MMNELKEVKKAVNPTEVLLVVDAMTGQEAAGIQLHLVYSKVGFRALFHHRFILNICSLPNALPMFHRLKLDCFIACV